ncbi:hypothetical protein [Sessilibacter corallicola]|uniref:hypothetical protein n=1 Tax=Sessilibacter corallicola TaxID=2904075 RepID=UPI001E312854|nr:hypothetical protein [Sessilibacter corallicola]MCE2029308.1 hypothetical protein [Sessilibacter corallicola]
MLINDLEGKVKEFATACFDMNSIEELEAPHAPENADESDCAEWGITAEEWSQAIEAALNEKKQ